MSCEYHQTKTSVMESDKEILVEYHQKYAAAKKRTCILVSAIVTAIVLIVTAVCTLGVYFGVYYSPENDKASIKPKSLMGQSCSDPCILNLVESIPDNLTFVKGAPLHSSTYEGIMSLMANAKETIEIASYYWTLNGQDLPFHDNSSWEGESILETLISTGRDKKIKIKIVQNKPKGRNNNTEALAKYAGAEVRTLDFDKLLGNGIIHTKMWLIDRKHFYVGSANLDWRSYTQVKELGAVIYNCPCMAKDMGKLFDVYWYLGVPGTTVPSSWPSSYSTDINSNTSMQIQYNGTAATTYLSSSPPPFCPNGRTVDIDAIVDVIHKADKFVYIAVMDYFPTTQFSRPRKYWPVIDDALRRAAFDRRISVKLLISYWNNTWAEMPLYLKSLNVLKYSDYGVHTNIEVRMFVVPAFTESQRKIPFARVNHNKYMVTDKTAYIGTSNWSGDYFIDTGGIGLIVNQNVTAEAGNVRKQLEDIFYRDWDSQYSTNIDHFNFTTKGHTEL
ncbi:5'-3' exonuclease PLD3-like isoform X1 [Mytilus trossulus]|uniref:5'-3' exonuclease PLD3-like isoform X1 n=1 Tax=Mytilus trossulus TaxID=6551 RepID=UPI0030076035